MNEKLLTTLCSSAYFFLFAGLGVLSPYVPMFFEASKQYSKPEIGSLLAIQAVSLTLCGPLWSLATDRIACCSLPVVLIGCLTVSQLLTCLVYHSPSWAATVGLVVASSIIKSPVTSLLDAFVLTALADPAQYGNLRLWGAISFGILSFGGGVIVSWGFIILFYLALGFACATSAVLVALAYLQKAGSLEVPGAYSGVAPSEHGKELDAEEQQQPLPPLPPPTPSPPSPSPSPSPPSPSPSPRTEEEQSTELGPPPSTLRATLCSPTVIVFVVVVFISGLMISISQIPM